MIQILAALALIPSASTAMTNTPGDVVNAIKSYGFSVQAEAPYTFGWIVSNDDAAHQKVKVGFVVGIDASNRPTSLYLYDYYKFQNPISIRAIQDRLARSGSQLHAQTYLNRTLNASANLRLDPSLAPDELKAYVNQRMWDFEGFDRWICSPLRGIWTEQFDLPLNREDADDRRVVDYLDFADLMLLVKHWGWENTKPFGWGFDSSWALAAMIEGRQYLIREATKSLTSLTVSATIVPSAGRLDGYKKAHPAEGVAPTPSTATVSYTLELGNGITLGDVKKQLLDFAHRMEKLGPAPESTVARPR